jgi:hypothetical protein
MMEFRFKKICEICGKEFETNYKEKKVCGPNCKRLKTNLKKRLYNKENKEKNNKYNIKNYYKNRDKYLNQKKEYYYNKINKNNNIKPYKFDFKTKSIKENEKKVCLYCGKTYEIDIKNFRMILNYNGYCCYQCKYDAINGKKKRPTAIRDYSCCND